MLARNPAHSLRILSESFSQSPRPYFVASLGGGSAGPFDFILRPAARRTANVRSRQEIRRRGFYDVWTSYHLPGIPHLARRVSGRSTTKSIPPSMPDNSISASATVRIHAERSSERLIAFEFSGSLTIESATLDGTPLPTFPDEGSTARRPRLRRQRHALRPAAAIIRNPLTNSTSIFIITAMSSATPAMACSSSDARESWYPHLGDNSRVFRLRSDISLAAQTSLGGYRRKARRTRRRRAAYRPLADRKACQRGWIQSW